MKQVTKVILFAAVLLSFTCIEANAQSKKVKEERAEMLKPFPHAQVGMVRHVIYMDKKSDESLYKVEIIPGKTMSVDCNIHSLMGKLEEKDLQGWGYTYYEFTSNGQTTSTMMACNKPNENRFVFGRTALLRYNSRLPIVVYAPEGYEVRYRIWKAGKEQSSPVM